MSVQQLLNKNQFVIYYEDMDCSFASKRSFRVFQSYTTLIAIYNPITKELKVNWSKWDYSKTTMKHLKVFINDFTCYEYENKAQFLNLITHHPMVELFEE